MSDVDLQKCVIKIKIKKIKKNNKKVYVCIIYTLPVSEFLPFLAGTAALHGR